MKNKMKEKQKVPKRRLKDWFTFNSPLFIFIFNKKLLENIFFAQDLFLLLLFIIDLSCNLP
jgi:hypothetical protein